MWTAPFGKLCFDTSNGLVGCGHMSGLLARRIWPLALMKSDKPRSLIIAASLTLMTIRGVSLAFGGDHCRSSCLVALAKLWKG
jgi:hypothetical protein